MILRFAALGICAVLLAAAISHAFDWRTLGLRIFVYFPMGALPFFFLKREYKISYAIFAVTIGSMAGFAQIAMKRFPMERPIEIIAVIVYLFCFFGGLFLARTRSRRTEFRH